MCSINARDRQQPTYFGDVSSSGGRTIINNATTAALK